MKDHQRITLAPLLANGVSQREVERRIGVTGKTIRRYLANSRAVATGSDPNSRTLATGLAPQLPKGAASACAPHRAFIEAQVALGRNALSIYQDLVDQHGFASKYNSVKRFVHTLKAREPERFDVLEFLPGEEAQVDYGQGALTRQANGQYRRPYLFVMTLKYSGKSFRKVVWKTDQQVWARLHEEAWHALGGCARYVVLDNLLSGAPHNKLSGTSSAGAPPRYSKQRTWLSIQSGSCCVQVASAKVYCEAPSTATKISARRISPVMASITSALTPE